jgi:hypothetical protein
MAQIIFNLNIEADKTKQKTARRKLATDSVNRRDNLQGHTGRQENFSAKVPNAFSIYMHITCSCM